MGNKPQQPGHEELTDAAIEAVMRSAAYWDPNDASHSEVVATVTRYYEHKYGTQKQDPIRPALMLALHKLDLGEQLPAYLQKALLKLHQAEVERIGTEHILPKLVERAAAAGHPKSNISRETSAYEVAGKQWKVSARTAQRAHRAHSVDPEERDDPEPAE